jgi:hypothetical protein
MQMGQSSYSMGLRGQGFASIHRSTTPQVKVSYPKRMVNPHSFLCNAVDIMFCILVLCRLKINHMKEL